MRQSDTSEQRERSHFMGGVQGQSLGEGPG